jgi:soluble lytic murein transglycosylase
MMNYVEHLFLATALVLISLCAAAAQAQTPRERHERIRASVESNQNASAVAELQTLATSDPSLFALNNYDYLLARLSERRGDLAMAAASFQKVAARNSLLSQYALWHLAQFARSTGNLQLERDHLRQLIAFSPTSLLRDAALARISESYFESGDYKAAIQSLQPLSSARGNASAREAFTLLGQAYLRSGQPSAARDVFNSLINEQPDASRPDDYALAAVRALDTLDTGNDGAIAQASAPQLPESEHLRRALIYHFNRDFAGARLHYIFLVTRYHTSAKVPDALYQTGRAFYQELQFDEAIKYFERVVKEYPSSANARDALNLMAAAYTRSKRTNEAVATYQQVIARFTAPAIQERAYLNIIDALREAARDDEALDWVKQTRSRFKGQTAALALFSQAKIRFAQGGWAAALTDLEALRREPDLGGMNVPGGTSQTEINFLRAFTLEQLGRTEEAVNAYLEIPEGRNEYYGYRATRRLRALASNAQTRDTLSRRLTALRTDAAQAISTGQAERARLSAQNALRLTEDATLSGVLLEIVRRAYGSLPSYQKIPNGQIIPAGRQFLNTNESARKPTVLTHQTLADELLFLGLYDEGAPELAVAENASGNAYTLAVYYKRGERADRAISFIEALWKNVPRDYLLELVPRETVELLYPAPYRAALLEYAPARNVDPRFVLAIMRQETRFRPEAKSTSAARGLLQFIPLTASTIAAQLNLDNFQQDDLYNPRIAILFGSQYMGNLFKLFPEMPQAVAASYNGGEDNVARWVSRARSNDADRYVAETGFAQTKDYIYKVIYNYYIYERLYTERLEMRQ